MWTSQSLDQLKDAVATYDRKLVDELCEGLVRFIGESDDLFPVSDAKTALNQLRRKRFFKQVRRVADALLQSGQTAGVIRRHYAQSLIECNELTAAIGVLEKLIQDCQDAPAEIAEARGLIGRASKQQYVNMPTASQRVRCQVLQRAINSYEDVYESAPSEYLWHGINAVACVKRAQRDAIPVTFGRNADEIAKEILATLERRTPDNIQYWDLATAAEASLALGRTAEALEWLQRYVGNENADAFEVASTLRQLREVWGLSAQADQGALVTVLDVALLQREGGRVILTPGDVKTQATPSKEQDRAFERVFGSASAVTYHWYQQGLQRARAVGRVEDRYGRAMGTGFLIRATDLVPNSKPNDLLFITNAHVLGRSNPDALRPEEAVVRFEAVHATRTFGVQELVWESPVSELDATILSLEKNPDAVEPLPLAPADEPIFVEGVDRRFYAIGYPLGGTLAVSLQDNTQVGWRRPRLHYRTPTEPGSSGSPIFDDSWRLIALHHAGSKEMARLDGHPGTYEANEGIWIHQIVKQLRHSTAPSATQAPAQVVAPRAARRKIFVSYCHKDKKYAGELEKFLKPFERASRILKWDDKDLQPGSDWLSEIRAALLDCRVAVMLVSQDYLASDFVSREEFPQILEGAEKGDLTIYWIAVRPAVVDSTSLGKYQAVNDPAYPLSSLRPDKRERLWVEIATKIEKAANAE